MKHENYKDNWLTINEVWEEIAVCINAVTCQNVRNEQD